MISMPSTLASDLASSTPVDSRGVMTSFRSFARYFALRYWIWYLGGLLTLALTTSISLYLPQLSKGIINALGDAVGSNSLSVSQDVAVPLFGELRLGDLPLLIIALGVLLTLVRSMSRLLIFWPGQKIAYDARSWMIRIFLRMRQQEFQKFGLGDLISRMTSDVTHLRLMCGFGLLQLANLVFLLVTALFLMLRTDAVLTAIALAPISCMLAVTYVGMPFISRYSREQQEVLGDLSNRVTEAFSNVQTIQVNLARPAFESLVERENGRNLRTSIKLLYVRTLTFPMMILFSGLAEVLVVYFGGSRVIQGAMTVGDILAFNIYVGLLSFPLGAVGMIIAMQQRAAAALRRLYDIESASREVSEAEKPTTNRMGAPSVVESSLAKSSVRQPVLEFRKVTFFYPSRPDQLVLKNVSLTVYSGERLGLCGPVGSGKSTLFALATRLFDPQPGMVFLQGVDVLECPQTLLRRRVRLMTQTVHLFSETVRGNLALGLDASVSEADLVAACRRARVWDDVVMLPHGLDTPIGERGVRLSGGQRQRLALARMFLRSGEVMLLDDVVSAVDLRTERGIIDELFAGKQPFIITSHRASTLERCDRVVYLVDGVVHYEGPFVAMDETLRQGLTATTGD
jgi:ATP-binding cassette subfamily B multidrug efflux pump